MTSFRLFTIGGSFFETHTPVTLDEYCNPALSQDILSLRNRDQVLGRSEKAMLERKDPKNISKRGRSTLLGDLWELAAFYASTLVHHRVPSSWRELESKQLVDSQTPKKVVLVSQAWIWKIGRGVIATDPETLGSKLSSDYWYRVYYSDPFVFITLLLSKIMEHFGSPAQGADKQLLRIYENALVTISEDVNQYTKHALVEDIDLDKEKFLSHQIKDLREELSMIKSVIFEQEEVWNEWMNVARPNGNPYQPQNSGSLLEELIGEIRLGDSADEIIQGQDRQTRAKFSKYRRRITKIEQDAERVEHNISVQLELKQKHATIKEAHSTAILSATVFGFTIITVIFAPLSFVVALFALPIDQFKEGKYGDGDVFSSSYIAKWVVTTEIVSIAITLIAMWAALRFADLHVWGKKGLRESIRRKAEEVRAKGRDGKEAADGIGDKDPVRGTKRMSDVEQGIEMADLHTSGQTS
ncbi:hypothetical protein F5Y08DRAFT_331250 [Xylaria arbuscula]|nr:hypothetical protein F5Y08DRAFT_331250 [Xylaria arbuscula]